MQQSNIGTSPEQKMFSSQEKPLINVNVVFLLGVLSIAFCWFYALPGLAMGVIAKVMVANVREQEVLLPGRYTNNALKTVHAGKICANIGIILSCIFLFFLIIKGIVQLWGN